MTKFVEEKTLPPNALYLLPIYFVLSVFFGFHKHNMREQHWIFIAPNVFPFKVPNIVCF